MNRGHLVGYQFSGLNDEGRNLVPMTAWLNTGSFTGTDDKNQSSMLYYENGLDSWLANHPNYYLDYKVTAVYKDDELIPRQIELQYVGIDQDGKLLEIQLLNKRRLRKKLRKRLKKKRHKKKLKKKQNKKQRKNRRNRKLKHQRKNRTAVIQVVTIEIKMEDGIDQMGSLLLKRKSEKLDYSGNLGIIKKIVKKPL